MRRCGYRHGCKVCSRDIKEQQKTWSKAHRERLALAAGGALAHRLLAALVAGLPLNFVVDTITLCIVAVHKQLPAGGSYLSRRLRLDAYRCVQCMSSSKRRPAEHPSRHCAAIQVRIQLTRAARSLPAWQHAPVCTSPLQRPLQRPHTPLITESSHSTSAAA